MNKKGHWEAWVCGLIFIGIVIGGYIWLKYNGLIQ